MRPARALGPAFRQAFSGRALLVWAVALALCAIVVWNGLANVSRSINPAFAVRVAPDDARARARLADRTLLEKINATTLKRAEGHALAAIARDPTVAMAYRVLGFARETSRGRAEAQKLILTSQRLSRRDLPTQLWLIENAVQRDDVAGALQHFDIALRTNKTAPAILFPILTNAAQDAELTTPIARLLAREPAWRERFIAFALDNAENVAPFAALADQLARRRSPLNAVETASLTRKLVAQEHFDIVSRQVVQRLGPRAQGALLPLGQPWLVMDPDFYPFSWQAATDPAVTIERVERGGGLRFDIDAAWNGELLKRLVVAPAGEYELTALASERVYVVVACAKSPRVQLALLDLTGARRSVRLRVPANNCPAQWITVGIRANTSDQPIQGSVNEVSLKPA